MRGTIAILPMDDRPVNYDYPGYLGRAAGYDIQVPPREWLGNPWRASEHIRLIEWLAQAARSADALILAIDTLAYGGLIPSRTSSDPFEQVLKSVSIVKDIKTSRPGLPILASSVIMRISRHNSSEEEKAYWAIYGSRIFRLSVLEHRIALGEADQAEKNEAEGLRTQIPEDVYRDYRAGRQRNHAINLEMLTWLEQGLFDYLIFPQDDTADYGWNIAEARALQARIRALGLVERAITYPGADEIGCLLLASYICRQAGFQPRVWPRYSSIHSPEVITSYEDRPIHELLKAHLAPLGGVVSDSPVNADLVLFLNAPAFKQGEGIYQWLAWIGPENLREALPVPAQAFLEEALTDPIYQNTRNEMESPQRSPEELVRALLIELSSGRPVALADVLCANGSDLILGDQLVRHPEIAALSGYGGWNTAGNTLGSVLAQAVLHVLTLRLGSPRQQTQAHLEFLFLRFLEDYYYQARERTLAFLEDLPSLGLSPTNEHFEDARQAAEVERCVRVRLQRAAAELTQVFIRSGMARQVQVENIHLPWQRLFEVGFDVKIDL
ncbi:MAG: DUF4127 family protein [Omnitrophica WOR_2 bacterium]